MTTAKTWRSKSGIIMFHLAMPSGGQPAAAIRRAVASFLEHAAEIGAAQEMDVSTRAGGESAHTWRDVGDSAAITQRLEAFADLTAVLVRCDLQCEGRDGGSFVIPAGLTFWAQLADIDADPDEPIELNVTLDTDVYLARTWGDVRDNRELAMRNAPRFNRFLADLLRSTAATVESVSADDYPGQLDATGVVLPTADGRA